MDSDFAVKNGYGLKSYRSGLRGGDASFSTVYIQTVTPAVSPQ
jgi:hypothetical protein